MKDDAERAREVYAQTVERMAVKGNYKANDIRAGVLTPDDERAIAAMLAFVQQPGGWRLTPREPTEAMVKAGAKAWIYHNGCDEPYDSEIPDIYAAMLDVAPIPGEE